MEKPEGVNMETGENSQSKRNEEEGGEEIHDMRVTHVVSGCVQQTNYWMPDLGKMVTVWGIRVEFSDGQTFCIPDLCDHRTDAEILLDRVREADLDADFLPYIVEDYLGELYGLRFP